MSFMLTAHLQSVTPDPRPIADAIVIRP